MFSLLLIRLFFSIRPFSLQETSGDSGEPSKFKTTENIWPEAMVLLCFILDLRTFSPPLLRDLKQCLLQLANLYAISSGTYERRSDSLRNRIGLCYIQKNRISCSDELKISYNPRGNFSLRDFHHAVNNLPTDGFLPEIIDSRATKITGGDVVLAKLLTKEVLYSWGDKDIMRKVILISSCLVENINSMRKILIDAADKCISVEFVLLEQEPGQHDDISQNVQEFVNSISDLENCSLQTHLPDSWILCGLVKRWLQELKDDLEESLQAVFLFKNNLAASTNQIFCNLFASANQIIDGFIPCQTCRCHGLPLDDAVGNTTKKTASCPITCQELGTSNLFENAVRVGEQTILFLPSFQSCPKFQQVSAPISFNVIERTNLGSLSEGVIIGNSFIVIPSACHEVESTSDECGNSELNTQLFQGICRALYSLDQGLVCFSNCNLETMREATFHCFYILQPSDKGPMLLRRLAGSEEILPIPDAIGSIDYAVPKETENSIQISLSRMELRDYNPLLHERGFHPKLNLLVKESLQFGSIPPKCKEMNAESKSPRPEPIEMTALLASTKNDLEEEEHTSTPQLTQATKEDKNTSVTEEWEQLIVTEDCKIYSPTCISIPKIKMVLSPPDCNKQLGEKTSRILERLEAPRQKKTKGSSPVIVSSGTDACMPKKKPLVPFTPNHATDQGMTLSQPMRPNFQRLKRKLR